LAFFQVTAHRRSELKDASSQIEQQMQKQKVAAAVENLKKKAAIWMDDQYFAAPPALQAVPGVAEVAPLGGFIRQYQVNVDPNKLLGYKIPINMVVDAVQKGNNDVGARLVEMTGREYMVRGRGYIKSLQDIENIVVMSNPQTGTPVLVRDIATVTYGPDIRRGVAELDGRGETVGGVVIMRFGENAQKVIDSVRAKIEELKPTLPKGLEIVPTYDRSELIDRSVDNLKHTIIEELLIVSLVILIFLWHFPSAIIPITMIPITVILAFIPMQLSGMTANIMSLGGVAVAIGALIDASVVMVEQIHKKLEHWEAEGCVGSRYAVLISSIALLTTELTMAETREGIGIRAL
jgi:Cu(I)/Ag(I) efflux system membrane protein CusA/SilA